MSIYELREQGVRGKLSKNEKALGPVLRIPRPALSFGCHVYGFSFSGFNNFTNRSHFSFGN
jgi:hypothetical protein